MRNPILVALDVRDAAQVRSLVRQLSPLVGGFKVGKELFVREGPDLVRRLRGEGCCVFLDLKFHDIPNTVARAVEAAVALDVQMLTVHTSGGRTMLETAEQAAQRAASEQGHEPPLVLGVTLLTSLDPRHSCGIATFAVDGLEPGALSAHLWREHKILTVAIEHEDVRGTRVSPHVYTSPEEIDRFADAVESVLRDGLPSA